MILMILTTYSNGPFWVDSLALIDRMFDSRQKCRIASVNQINSSINATGSPVSASRTMHYIQALWCRCGWQRLKWLLAGSPQVAKAGRRQKRCAMAWRTGEGPSDKGWPWNLSWHRHHFENSPFGFCCFRFSLLSLTQVKYKTFGGMSLLEWKSRWEKGQKGGWEIAILS